jgi:hypothetical protein
MLIKKQISVSLSPDEIKQAQQEINIHFLGTKNCNRKTNYGDFLPNYDTNSELGKALEEAHRNLRRNSVVTIEVFIDPQTGNLVVKN